MRPAWRGVRLAAVVALILLCADCGDRTTSNGDRAAPGGTSAASCVGPYVNDQPPSGAFHGPIPTVDPGQSLTVYGHWYNTTCNDTGGHDPWVPMHPVRLTLTLPGGSTVDLGRFTPGGSDMGFSTAVHVPAGTPAGTAWIRDNQQPPAAYRFKIGRETPRGPR
jgi:hypothetical protein